ncbi:MAG: hypothetical protein ABI442_06995, partial [Gemmatimonadaceae bacterium]
VRRALEAPVSWRGVPVWSNRTDLFADTPALPVCAGDRSVGARARESLLMLAVDARAHGMAVRRARYRPGSMRAGVAASLLGMAPYAPDAGDKLVSDLRAAILSGLGGSVADQGVLPVVPANFRSSASICVASAH